jgi:two-component system, NtrC family, response regulator AtoC
MPTSTDVLTLESLGANDGGQTPRAFLVVDHLEDAERGSQVVDLPDGVDVLIGRSSEVSISVDHESVSRTHARVRRSGDAIEIEDLGSRNGTQVNGRRITGVHRLASGDEISIGPIIAVVGVTSALRRSSPVADAAAGAARLAAEVDRSVRYFRPLTLCLMRIPGDVAVDTIGHALRPMDLIAEDAGDEYILILPELDRAAATTSIERIVAGVRSTGAPIAYAIAISPYDGTTVEALIGHLRGGLRTGGSSRAPADALGAEHALTIDPAMKRVYSLVDRIAGSPMTVLILGEPGVGKGLVARAIHRGSSRREGPFVELNCAALPEEVLESELFGRRRGAARSEGGFFEVAAGGTLFLDEIGELPRPLQTRLLRVIERLAGGAPELAADVRFVTATHRDLEAEVRAGRFRRDLLSRIGAFMLAIPPLRDRPVEILPLAEHFARSAAAEAGRSAPSIGDDARDALCAYSWPGNVRELKNTIERALVLCDDTITIADLPDRLSDASQRVRPVAPAADVRGQLAEAERTAIIAALEAEHDNQTRAARRLGLSRRTLIYKMERYGLKSRPGR